MLPQEGCPVFGKSCVYLCTEPPFPIARFNQLSEIWEKKHAKTLKGGKLGDKLFVKEIPSVQILWRMMVSN